MLAIIAIGYDNIVLTKISVKIWEQSNIATTKSDGVRNMSSQTGYK